MVNHMQYTTDMSLAARRLTRKNSFRRNDIGVAIPYWDYIAGTSQDQNERLMRIADSGCAWLRTDAYWYHLEEFKGNYTWTGLDNLIAKTYQVGIRVVLVIHTSPAWNRPSGATVTYGPTTSIEQDNYAAFCAKLVERYGTRVAAYEIWNEPNLDQFWSPTPSAADYTSLLQKSYTAMKAINPSITAITGGTGGAAPDGKDIDPELFISGIYSAGGKDYCDGITVHPYTNKDGLMSGGLWQAVTRIRPLMDSKGDTQKLLWGTETGTPTKGNDAPIMPEYGQERLVADTTEYWETMHHAGPLCWYTLEDHSHTAVDTELYFGFWRKDKRCKLAYNQLQITTGKKPTIALPMPTSYPSRIVSVTDYGAAVNGTTDDTAALTNAINDVKTNGGIITIPNHTLRVVLDTSTWITVPSNVTIRGLGSQSTISVESPNANYHELFRLSGQHIRLENLSLRRKGVVYGAMLNINASSDVWLNRLHIDGSKDIAGNPAFHGIFLSGSAGATSDGIYMIGMTMRRCDFGLLHTSQDTSTIRNVFVQQCLFEDNLATDLEFNAPNSIMQSISVKDSTFRSNKAQGPGAGWSVGLANVQQCEISGNGITGYIMNGIHIEDRSSQVTITNNLFTTVSTKATTYESAVFIISGSHDITVSANTFDTRPQTNPIDCVYVGTGGAGYAAPYNVTATNNIAYLANNSRFISIYGGTNIVSTPNTIL